MVIVIDDAHPSPFSHPLPCPAEFSDPASALHEDTRFGMGLEIIDDIGAHTFGEEALRSA
jgi:hypothetical protein